MYGSIYPAKQEEGCPYIFDIQHLPHKGLKQVTRTAFDGFSIQARTKFPSESWQFLKWLVGKPGIEMIAEMGKRMPSLREVAESPLVMDPSAPPDVPSRQLATGVQWVAS